MHCLSLHFISTGAFGETDKKKSPERKTTCGREELLPGFHHSTMKLQKWEEGGEESRQASCVLGGF